MPSQIGVQVLQVQDVTADLAGRTVLRVPSLSVRAGELIQVTGENGSGKTTLLRILSGTLPIKGSVRLGGHVASSVAARENLILVPTEAILPDDLTVQEYLTFSAATWSKPHHAVLELADKFRLGNVMDAWPSTLSRGTRQKVALSAALGLRLPVTLLDEPFSTLDSRAREVLLTAILARVQEGGAVLVTTHGDELGELARRVVQVQDGEIAADSKPVTA